MHRVFKRHTHILVRPNKHSHLLPTLTVTWSAALFLPSSGLKLSLMVSSYADNITYVTLLRETFAVNQDLIKNEIWKRL